MTCGNGSERTQHPIELFGADWVEWAAELHGDAAAPDPTADPVQATGADSEAPR
jgi:hypothetical protein